MREALVHLFKERLQLDLWQDFIPENNESWPIGCYAISNEVYQKELDGEGVSSHECIFEVDILAETIDELDFFRDMLLNLSGKRNHRYTDHFQLMVVRSVGDVGTYEATAGNVNPSVIGLQISLFK